MKKILFFVLMLSLAACGEREKASMKWLKYKGEPMTTIKEGSDFSQTVIRFSRGIVFNEAGTAIQTMPPNSYLSYDKNGQLLIVESDEKGRISYEFYEEDTRQPFDEKGKVFLKNVIREIRRLDKKM
ncbi:hypothetical protein P1X15_20845 [Runella sp. MFBS21]|uniref:hypothetical protein n=1 Tax=Runella sp. MFBS21 TaxID=3034018 RepID=UPI0023F7A44A|nr:hypothetical protein [Runella sp. MFBS21]MDF7820080.1 hypothetical protein [Runella sp. MFBS21]